MSLLNELKQTGVSQDASVLSESMFFNNITTVSTDLPILNLAFSGDFSGGIVPGISIFAGASKSFKSMLALMCMKSYLDSDPKAIAVLYDSEFGITPEYLKSLKVDTTRVLHVPVEHLEQLKFDIVKKLEKIKRGDKVFFMIDSLGALASKKEVDDAIDEKSVADMTRAKAIRSLLRMITPHFTMKLLPCIVINHIYTTMELYSKPVVGGGTAVMYSANQIFIITKSQEKDGDDLAGWKFTINIEKSRYVREKSKFPFVVAYESGINKYSGLFDLAVENQYVVNSKKGWYQTVDLNTGELSDKSYRRVDLENNKAYWEAMVTNDTFNKFVRNKYQLGASYIDEGHQEEITQDEQQQDDE